MESTKHGLSNLILPAFQLLTVDHADYGGDEIERKVDDDDIHNVAEAGDEHHSAAPPLFFLDTKADTNITKELNVNICLSYLLCVRTDLIT